MNSPYRSVAICAGALLIAGACDAATPTIIAVGTPGVNGTKLKPYNNAWLFRAVFPDGKTRDQGVWSDHLEPMTIEGRHTLPPCVSMSVGQPVFTRERHWPRSLSNGIPRHGNFTSPNEPVFKRAVSILVVRGPSTPRNLDGAVLNAGGDFAGWLSDNDDQAAIAQVGEQMARRRGRKRGQALREVACLAAGQRPFGVRSSRKDIQLNLRVGRRR